MAKGGAWKWILGTLGLAGLGAAVFSGGSASGDEPKVPTPEPPIPTPGPDATSSPEAPDVVELVDADDFASAQVLEAFSPQAGGRTDVPRTILVGYSEGWTGKDAALARMLELAPATPDVQFVVFSFTRSRELFGQPDAPLAYVATAVDPEGVPRAPEDHFTSTNLGAPALGDSRWQSLIDYARKGYGWGPGYSQEVIEHGGKAYTVLFRPKGAAVEWLVWDGSRASDLKTVRRGVHTPAMARQKAHEAVAAL